MIRAFVSGNWYTRGAGGGGHENFRPHREVVRVLYAVCSPQRKVTPEPALDDHRVRAEPRNNNVETAGISTGEHMAQFNEIVKKAKRGGRSDWARSLLGGADVRVLVAEYADDSLKPTPPVPVKNTLDFVKALDDSVSAEEPPPGAIRAVYALLCDVGDPAVGGYMLYCAVPQPPGQLKVDGHPNTRMAAWFVGSIIGPTANRLMRHVARSLNRLTHIASAVKAG